MCAKIRRACAPKFILSEKHQAFVSCFICEGATHFPLHLVHSIFHSTHLARKFRLFFSVPFPSSLLPCCPNGLQSNERTKKFPSPHFYGDANENLKKLKFQKKECRIEFQRFDLAECQRGRRLGWLKKCKKPVFNRRGTQ